MSRFVLLAAVSVLTGLALGAAAIIGVTRVAEGQSGPALPQTNVRGSVSEHVQYGDRCVEGVCVPEVPKCWNGHCVSDIPRCWHGHCVG